MKGNDKCDFCWGTGFFKGHGMPCGQKEAAPVIDFKTEETPGVGSLPPPLRAVFGYQPATAKTPTPVRLYKKGDIVQSTQDPDIKWEIVEDQHPGSDSVILRTTSGRIIHGLVGAIRLLLGTGSRTGGVQQPPKTAVFLQNCAEEELLEFVRVFVDPLLDMKGWRE